MEKLISTLTFFFIFTGSLCFANGFEFGTMSTVAIVTTGIATESITLNLKL